MRETDIEHIVAMSEAHDSGPCARGRATRVRIALDLRNLAPAAPHVNRREKSGKGAAEWLPHGNRCCFRGPHCGGARPYGLTIHRHEPEVLERVSSQCGSVDMEPVYSCAMKQ